MYAIICIEISRTNQDFIILKYPSRKCLCPDDGDLFCSVLFLMKIKIGPKLVLDIYVVQASVF